MKNRFLPLSLITAFIGLFLLLFSVLTIAGQLFAGEPGKPELRKFEGPWLESARANQLSGQVNLQDVVKARQQADLLRGKSSSGSMALNWLSAGPDNNPGVTRSAIFDNTDPSGSTIIAGATNGGIWKSINQGLTWVQMPVEGNLNLNVSSMVQTSDGVIYAATGVVNCTDIQTPGKGIFRTNSNGQFGPIPGTLGITDFEGIIKLAINKQTGRIYAATVGGLYQSDNGNEWVKVLPGLIMDIAVGADGTMLLADGDSAYMAPLGDINARVTLTTGKPDALPKSGIFWMVFAIAPSNDSVMYASLANSAGNLLGVYLSADKGATWSVVFPNNTSFEPYAGFGCYSNTIAVFPNDPYKVYLGGLNMWFGQRVLSSGFYYWEKLSFGDFGTASPYYAPWYHHCYAFNPKNPNQLVMATDGGISLATSEAGNVTFQTSNKEMQTTQFTALSYSAQKSYVMGGGFRVGTLALGYFCPSEVSFPSTGYQVYREDAGAFPADYQPQPADYCGTGGTSVWSSVDSRIAVYTKYRGEPAVRRQDFTDINNLNNFTGNIDTISSDHVVMGLWESFNQGQEFGVTRDSVKFYAIAKTIPADTTLMIQSSSNKFLFPYVTTDSIPKNDSISIADPIAGRFFIYGDSTGVGKGIFMTKDMLKFDITPEYFCVFKDNVANDPITTLAVSANITTAWAGTKKGRLIRITGLQNAYDAATASVTSAQCVLVNTVFTSTPFVGRTVTSISIDPKNTDRVLVTLGNYGNQQYVYFTQNANTAVPVFNPIQGNLPEAPVYSGLLEMHGNTAIVGTDHGVFSTSDLSSATPQWAPDIQNIGDVPVMEIRQQVMYDYHIKNYGVIYLASYGRGLWMDTTYYSPVGIDPVKGSVTANGRLYLNPNPVTDRLVINYTNEKTGNRNLTVYDLSGRILLNSSLGIQPKGVFTTTVNLNTLTQGTYIVQVGSSYGKIVKL
ncbi:MAG: T9SS type A sorting domain-containing protein [Bacteroidetes bacterium]|nr:T9SS type A sorting domain-containing protein [Bacteroidota bacterium]